MILKSIIVDDELMARKSLERFCDKSDIIQIEGSFEDAESALNCLNNQKIDVIFLDIEMPGMSGIDLLDALAYMPHVVFTTSNREYAYEAFEYDIVDFLKKPISWSRFQRAVEKVVEKEQSLDAVAERSAATEIYIKSDGRLVRIPFKDILFFETTGDYVKLVTAQKNYLFHGTIKALDAKLNSPRLLKVHRSYIINLDHIVDLEDNTLVIGKHVIPVSRAYKPILLGRLNIV